MNIHSSGVNGLQGVVGEIDFPSNASRSVSSVPSLHMIMNAAKLFLLCLLSQDSDCAGGGRGW